ncbi:MAG: uracil-DNA glycosylase [Chloroflexi bacterium]|nr:uracil-DNA glycosylase [Chloroflexota bacterium]
MTLLPAGETPLMMATCFSDLVDDVHACRRCPSMEGRRRVLSRANGTPGARVMFIAEAPGRHGGEVTGVPLTRDLSGRRFSRLLEQAGIDRAEVFITNAVLCNPRDDAGRNRTPTRREVRTCSGWLAEQIRLVDPRFVVTLGRTALDALSLVEQHSYTLRQHVGRAIPWQGRTLVPLYHPSPRAGLSRGYEQQDEDFRRLGVIVRAALSEHKRAEGAPRDEPH